MKNNLVVSFENFIYIHTLNTWIIAKINQSVNKKKKRKEIG